VDINTLAQVNKRYQFGDLRLGRINSTYRVRYFHTHFVRGYLYGYNRYVEFFQRKFGWILIVFVFFSLVLSAMQVGAGLDELKDSNAFLKSSYVFVVFSIVSVVAVLAVVAVIFIIIFFFNMVAAINHAKQAQRKRKKMAYDKLGGAKEA
jgi:succinate dehydrogenase/fumarate reductase cytochrome b subunit